MLKMSVLRKSFTLAALVLAIGGTLFPVTTAKAAGLYEQVGPPVDTSALESAWAREQRVYQREEKLLGKSSKFIERVQALISRAAEKGLDTTSIQAAVDSFSAVLPAVQAAHAPGAAIIASHAGFDTNGKVTNRDSAIATVKSLAEVLHNTRAAMNGTLRGLRKAILLFRIAHPRPPRPFLP